MSVHRADVCIVGAGMAGLTLARQLQRRKPDLAITLVEHRVFPVAEATHKVGESTVEICAHYLAHELDLTDHLTTEQLPKFGLRLFMRGEQPIVDDLAKYDEVGVSRVLPVPTYQIDRGRFENYLAGWARDAGISLLDGTTVKRIEVNAGDHRVTVSGGADASEVRCRYLVDATGRRGFLRNQLELTRSARHSNNAVWFRVQGEIDLDSLSRDGVWRGRCEGVARRLSTNHFTGPGYWLWLIPLASQTTSVGVVFDPSIVSGDRLRKHDDLLNWVAEEHPIIAAELRGRDPLDFHVMQNYAVATRSVFSTDGWMSSGDSGAFSDPFYSPGGDFIAFANSYITEMICTPNGLERAPAYQSQYLSFFASTISLYRGEYGGFGDRNMMVAKTLWDYTYYWGALSKIFFSKKFLDLRFMQSEQPVLQRAAVLNNRVQRSLRELARQRRRIGGEGRFYDHHELPLFHEMKNDLLDGSVELTGARLRHNVERLEVIATEVEKRLQSSSNAFPAFDQVAGFG